MLCQLCLTVFELTSGSLEFLPEGAIGFDVHVSFGIGDGGELQIEGVRAVGSVGRQAMFVVVQFGCEFCQLQVATLELGFVVHFCLVHFE